MAGLYGPRVLLLAAGLIALANCQVNPTGIGQVNPTVSPSPLTVQEKSTGKGQVNPTDQGPTTGPPTTLCSYQAQANASGFLFTFENVIEGNYSIQLTEAKDSKEETVYLNATDATHRVLYLKPSTTYRVHISRGEFKNVTCGRNTSLKTNDINQDDIEEVSADLKQNICYGTDWNISAAVPGYSDKIGKRFTFCIQPNYTSVCTNLTIRHSGFHLTKWIGLEFLNTTNIILEVPNKLPPEIKWTNQGALKCTGLEMNYTCQGPGQAQPISVDQLEPYTQYNCTGKLHQNQTIAINKTITKIVKITCDDITPIVTNKTSDNRSISFELDGSSKQCPNFSNHQNLTYTCDCGPTGQSKSTRIPLNEKHSCKVDNLKPFTSYNCKIQPYFNNNVIGKMPKKVPKITTDPGVPNTVKGVHVSLKENNGFDVTCKHLESGDWKGPKRFYFARVTQGTTAHNEKKNETDCFFEFRDLSYSTEYKVLVFAFNGHFNGTTEQIIIQTSYNDKVLIGFLVFLILLTSLALAFVLYKIYILQRKKAHQDGSLLLTPQTNEEDQLMHLEPIGAEVLLDVYKKKIADEGRLFLAEFQSIPRIFSRNTMKEAKKSYNAVKNRYVDILPYDYNRVQLTSGNGESGCDYINASFINGFRETKKYIAAQGPKDETVAAFWRMTWEQKSSIIVMVTRCEESNRVKCAQYWPPAAHQTEVFEEFVVKLHKEEQCPDYIIRRLTLSNKRENSEREVTQIQFISWPDHGVPEDPQLLLKLRKRVNTFKNLFSGPIVIHCSAGVGRTGTYISIDAMMESLESEQRMDIYGYIVNLRKQRCLMVQVETQYILIHQAMIEHNEFGETEISLPEFHSTLSVLKETGSGGENSLLLEEFKRLPKYSNRRTCNTGLSEENQKKNRFSSVIPYDYNRVLVKLEENHREVDVYQEEDETTSSSEEEDEDAMKYINASQIDGYWGSSSLITAQSPLASTTADFWLMVYQKRATAIVNLSDCAQGDTECSPYWDQDKKAFEDIEVEVTETEVTPVWTIRTMQIYHTKRKESRRVKQFHFLQWPCQKLPENSGQLTDMIRSIKQTCGYSTGPLEGRGPLVVHCSDGSRQCGVFCVLWNLMDSAQTERMVDVFQMAKAQRRQRQGMISSMEQYQFLYEAMAAAYPVQNGDVMAAPVGVEAGDAVDIVDETGQTQEPADMATDGQQEAAASTPLMESLANEEQDEAVVPVTTAAEAANNGSTVTMEV